MCPRLLREFSALVFDTNVHTVLCVLLLLLLPADSDGDILSRRLDQIHRLTARESVTSFTVHRQQHISLSQPGVVRSTTPPYLQHTFCWFTSQKVATVLYHLSVCFEQCYCVSSGDMQKHRRSHGGRGACTHFLLKILTTLF